MLTYHRRTHRRSVIGPDEGRHHKGPLLALRVDRNREVCEPGFQSKHFGANDVSALVQVSDCFSKPCPAGECREIVSIEDRHFKGNPSQHAV